jgi:hypothetical protein
MELAVAVGDIGQAPKVEVLTWSEGTDHDEELTKEEDTIVWGNAACTSNEAGGSGHRRT